MGLPTAWTTVQVFGTYLRTDGTPNPGSVWFEVDQDVHINDDGGTPIAVMPKRQIAALDANGHFSIFLPATDDPHITPTGWTYQVSEKFAGGQPDYSITVPAALASTGINLVQYPHATPVPVDPPTVTYLTTADLGVTVGTQGDVTTAVSQSGAAVVAATAAETTANNALGVANGAVTTANGASTAAGTAVATANTANATANTASTTATAASTAAANATTTANAASSSAAAAVATANTANTNASAAVATANTANTNATTALNTANSAAADAANAVTTANGIAGTANTALTNANNAVTTANNANATANTAQSTANAAQTTANAALPATSNAVSASKWATPRTITLSGDAAGSTAIDGSANVTLATTVSHASTANTWTTPRTLTLAGDSSGNVTLDGSANVTLTTTVAHATAATTAAAWTTPRTITLGGDASGSVTVDGSADATLNATVNNAVNATLAVSAISATSAGRWTTPRTITLTGGVSGSVTLDGSADVTCATTLANINPMNAANDIIIGGTGGALTRLAKGSNGQALTIDNSGNVNWGPTVQSVTAVGVIQGTAAPLLPGVNQVVTASGQQAVLLPASTPAGIKVAVVQNGANQIFVYPPTGGAIDNIAVNTAYRLLTVSTIYYQVVFTSLGSGNWASDRGSQTVSGTSFVLSYTNHGLAATDLATFVSNTGGNTMASQAGIAWTPYDQGTVTSGTTSFVSGYSRIQRITLGGNITIVGSVNTTQSALTRLLIFQDATGGRTVTWGGTNIVWLSGSAPVLNSAANAVTVLEFTYDITTNKFYGHVMA